MRCGRPSLAPQCLDSKLNSLLLILVGASFSPFFPSDESSQFPHPKLMLPKLLSCIAFLNNTFWFQNILIFHIKIDSPQSSHYNAFQIVVVRSLVNIQVSSSKTHQNFKIGRGVKFFSSSTSRPKTMHVGRFSNLVFILSLILASQKSTTHSTHSKILVLYT
jgi:hypothetical protein